MAVTELPARPASQPVPEALLAGGLTSRGALEAAADELGASCPPLICTDGIPATAALDLIAGAATAGCQIHVRADVDAAGFVVVEQVHSVAPAAALWRFDAASYARHLGRSAGSDDGCSDFGHVLADLRELFAREQTPLHEEAVLVELLADLAYRAAL